MVTGVTRREPRSGPRQGCPVGGWEGHRVVLAVLVDPGVGLVDPGFQVLQEAGNDAALVEDRHWVCPGQVVYVQMRQSDCLCS